MEILKVAWRRIIGLLTKASIERDIDTELRLHVDLLAEEYQRGGLSPEEARRAALRRFGSVQQLKERGLDVRGFGALEAIVRDAKYGVRSLWRTPTFTAIVVSSLALGIGANTAIFSIVYGFLLRPLPYPGADRLVALYESIPGYNRASVSPANWLDWQRESRTFESFAAWNFAQATVTGGSEPLRVPGQKVSAELFRVMGMEPMLGRTFARADDEPGAAPVAIISHRLWRQSFGGDPAIVGKTLELDAIPHRIAGVMPPAFHLIMRDVDYWVPLALDRTRALRRDQGRFIQVVGRVKPSVAVSTAAAEMAAIARQLQIHPSNRDVGVALVPLREVIGGDIRTPLIVSLAIVSLFLLVACFNVASMLLARSATRAREMSIRAALGAGRGAIARQLLVESLLLASAGGACGIVLAIAATSRAMQSGMAQVADVSLDFRVLLYAIAVSLITGIGFGLAPSLTAARGPARDYLRGDGMPHSRRLRYVLVTAQVAMTVVLLCAGGLLARSLNALVGAKTGLAVENVLTMSVGLPLARYGEAARADFFKRALVRITSLPGVESAAAAASLPVVGPPLQDALFHVSGTPLRYPTQDPVTGLSASALGSVALTGPFVRVRVATPGYFKTLGIPVVAGRDFTEQDRADRAQPVFIVNQAFAARYLPAADPLSARVSVMGRPDNPYGDVVGIAGDVYDESPRVGAAPTVFYVHAQLPVSEMTLFVRAKSAPGLQRAVVQSIRDLDKNLAVSSVQMLKDALGTSMRLERLASTISSAVAFTALLLAALGVYGLLACLVAERTREIGIRIALGAEAWTVVRMVIVRGLRLIACGSAVGLAGGLGVSQLIRSLLYGVTATDPATFLTAIGMAAAVGTMASAVPAIRAARVDALIALRQE